jgi:hypothetical protein
VNGAIVNHLECALLLQLTVQTRTLHAQRIGGVSSFGYAGTIAHTLVAFEMRYQLKVLEQDARPWFASRLHFFPWCDPLRSSQHTGVQHHLTSSDSCLAACSLITDVGRAVRTAAARSESDNDKGRSDDQLIHLTWTIRGNWEWSFSATLRISTHWAAH